MKGSLRIATFALCALCAGAAQAAAGQALGECTTLSGSQQVSKFGNQYVLVRDGDTYYRLAADGCNKLSMATKFQLSAESQPNRICPTQTRVETNAGSCTASKAELIDEATYRRYMRRR